MNRSVAEKLGIKAKMRSILINAPAGIMEDIDPPELELVSRLRGDFDYIHFFVQTQSEFHKKFARLAARLKPTGTLWLSWPKSGREGTDLNITTVIKLGYDYGLVESKCLSINATWSALKFTHPKSGKEYNNSYGKLKK